MYSPASTHDKCTLDSDQNLINRRNVKSDVDAAVNAARQFFLLEIKARIVAAAMIELDIDEFDDANLENKSAPKFHTTKEKKEFLYKLSSTVVDDKRIVSALDQLEERQLQKLNDRTVGGRYKCWFPGCEKTFKSDGKWRQMHEQSHDRPVYIEEQPMLAEVHSSNDVSDDTYNYQMAWL